MLLIRIVLTFLFFSTLASANQPALEYKVKAAYLYNFTKFIKWPERQTETFNLCILQPDPFGSLLEPLEQRTALDKPIKLVKLSSIQEAGQCHILYIGDESRLRSVRLGTVLPGVLTISSLDDTVMAEKQPFFTGNGGMIGFVIRDGKVKLQINLIALRKNGLKISAKLMEVAELVEGEKSDE